MVSRGISTKVSPDQSDEFEPTGNAPEAPNGTYMDDNLRHNSIFNANTELIAEVPGTVPCPDPKYSSHTTEKSEGMADAPEIEVKCTPPPPPTTGKLEQTKELDTMWNKIDELVAVANNQDKVIEKIMFDSCL